MLDTVILAGTVQYCWQRRHHSSLCTREVRTGHQSSGVRTLQLSYPVYIYSSLQIFKFCSPFRFLLFLVAVFRILHHVLDRHKAIRMSMTSMAMLCESCTATSSRVLPTHCRQQRRWNGLKQRSRTLQQHSLWLQVSAVHPSITQLFPCEMDA